MQESRLFKIVYHLLDKGQATASELAEKFEVSVRTIYRDIDALSGAGIPVYAEAGRNGGIRLMNDFVLDKAVLFSAMFQLNSENWLEVDFSRWGDKQFDNEQFELLKSAVIHCKCVRIQYAGSCGAVSERIVQPHKLIYKAKAWYLKAFCMEKQDWRLFKLSRIIDLEILNESFHRRSFPDRIDTSEGEYNQITLRFPKEMAYRVYDEFDKTQVQRQQTMKN